MAIRRRAKNTPEITWISPKHDAEDDVRKGNRNDLAGGVGGSAISFGFFAGWSNAAPTSALGAADGVAPLPSYSSTVKSSAAMAAFAAARVSAAPS